MSGEHLVQVRPFESRNPAHPNEILGSFQASNADDVDAAVAAGRRAQREWRKIPAPRRGEMIERATMMLVERKAESAELVTREMGKTLVDSGYDVQGAITSGRYMAGEGFRMFGDTVPSSLPNRMAMTRREPVGVVGIITPWNLPILMPAWKLFPALICGNTVVVKPAEDTPFCAVRLLQILEEAGFPPGVVNLVTGFGESAGQPLIEHPDVDMISFTGSQAVGRRIAATAGQDLKHVSLEMGGKNAIVVLDGGYFYAPILFDRVEPEMRIAQEEIFGPTVSVLRVHGDHEAIEVANGTNYGLSASVYSTNVNRALAAVAEFESGLAYINAPTIGSEIHLPFGGVKTTGNGHRESGRSAIEQFTEIKTVFMDYSGGLQRAGID